MFFFGIGARTGWQLPARGWSGLSALLIGMGGGARVALAFSRASAFRCECAIFFAMIRCHLASAFQTLASQFRTSPVWTGSAQPEWLSPSFSISDILVQGRFDSRLITYYLLFATTVVLFPYRCASSIRPSAACWRSIQTNFRAEGIGYRVVVHRTLSSVLPRSSPRWSAMLAIWLHFRSTPRSRSRSCSTSCSSSSSAAWARCTARWLARVHCSSLHKATCELLKPAHGPFRAAAGRAFTPDRWMLWLARCLCLGVLLSDRDCGKLRRTG